MHGIAGPDYRKRAVPPLGQIPLERLSFGICFATFRLFGMGANSHPGIQENFTMNCQTIDVAELKAQIDSLQRELEHPPRSMTHCERLSKMFLLRELQNELERAQHGEVEFANY